MEGTSFWQHQEQSNINQMQKRNKYNCNQVRSACVSNSEFLRCCCILGLLNTTPTPPLQCSSPAPGCDSRFQMCFTRSSTTCCLQWPWLQLQKALSAFSALTDSSKAFWGNQCCFNWTGSGWEINRFKCSGDIRVAVGREAVENKYS